MTVVLIAGLSVGVVYGIIGAGFVIVHRITGMVNFAQGEFAMAGAFGAVVAANLLPPGVAVLVGGVVGAAAGMLLYGLVVHPLRNHGLLVQTIASLGAALVFRSLAQLVFGTQPYTVPPLIDASPLRLLGASVQIQVLWLLALGLALYWGLGWFFDRTMVGRAMSACAITRYAAGVVGIDVVRMAAIAFLVSGAVTGIAGAMAAPLTFATAASGLSFSLKGFVAAVLGGFHKIGLAIVGGVLVGVVEALSASEISSTYQDVIVLGLLLVLLVVRPSGLARTEVVERA